MWRASGRGGAGSDRSEGLGDVRDPGLLPEVEYRTGVLRQQAVPGPTRSSGLERAECGAGAPDGVVRGDTDGPVVCRQWSCRCAGGSAALVVSAQGDADVQRHAGGVAVADVAASGFWGFRCRGALTRMPRNATPDALRCGIVVRNTSRISAAFVSIQSGKGRRGMPGGSAVAEARAIIASHSRSARLGPSWSPNGSSSSSSSGGIGPLGRWVRSGPRARPRSASVQVGHVIAGASLTCALLRGRVDIEQSSCGADHSGSRGIALLAGPSSCTGRAVPDRTHTSYVTPYLL